MKKRVIYVGALLVVSSHVLSQQTHETVIDEVTVASKIPQQLYKTGKNVKLLTHEDLKKYQGQSVAEVLQQVAGLQLTGSSNNAQEPKFTKVRGGKLANILILLDGVPLKDVTGNDYSAADLRLLALENIAQIEVLSGASSVLYGSNAAGAVINIRTQKSTAKTVEGEVAARGGSYGTFAQNAAVRGQIKGFHYQISGFNEKSDGFSSAEGQGFDKDGFEKQNASATVGYRGARVSANVQAGWNHHLFEYDAGAFADGRSRGDDTQKFIGAHSDFRYNKGQLVANLRYTNTERTIQGYANDTYRDEYFYGGNNLFAELFNNYNVSERFSITAGVQHERQQLGSSSLPWGGSEMQEDLKKADTELYNTDLFAKASVNYMDFHLDAGSRMTNNSRFGNHFVYSINPYYLKETAKIYYKIGYSFATAFIAPTLYQTYGTLPYTTANFDLKPERNSTHEVDLSIGNRDRSLLFNATAFLTEEQDVFAYAMNPDFTGNFVNVDENRIRGVEVGFDYRIIDQVKIGGNYSFVEKEKEATRLRVPKNRVNSYIDITPLEGTRIALSHQYVSNRADYYFDENFQRVDVTLEAYHLLNLNINQKLGKSFEVFGNIGNLLNTGYTDVVGFTTKRRNYTAGFSYRF